MPLNTTRTEVVMLAGGLNLSAPPMTVANGEALLLHNYVIDPLGRYSRVKGYERFDGRSRPSEQAFYALEVSGENAVIGSRITGDSSGATAHVLTRTNQQPPTGDWLIITDLNNPPFATGETLTAEGGTPAAAGTVVAPERMNFSPDFDTELEAGKLTADFYRLPIAPVPGAGPVRAVIEFKQQVLAIRDRADGTGAAVFEATPTGWQELAGAAGLFSTGGQYRHRKHNFSGAANADQLVIVNGVDNAAIFDGSTFTALTTGTPDPPTAVEVLDSNILLLGHDSGSLILSAIGEPTNFDVNAGAAEIAVGQSIIDMQIQPNQTVGIYCREALKVMYGKTIEDIRLTTLDSNSHPVPNTVKFLGDAVFVNERGITRLSRVEQFGDFDTLAVSAKVKTLLDPLRPSITTAFTVQEAAQYMLCFDTSLILSLTFNGREIHGFTTLDLGFPVRCASRNAIGPDGREAVYLGADDGFVYQFNKGDSFDGQPIKAVIQPAFNHFKSPESRKRFKKLILDVDTPSMATFEISPELDFGKSGTATEQNAAMLTAQGGAARFDRARWGQARFSVAAAPRAEAYITGVGQSLAPLIHSESDRLPPHTVTSITIQYEMRGRKR